MKSKIVLSVLFLFVIVLSILVSAIGLFSTSGGTPYDFVNQYGHTVTIYGDGLYAHDSLMKAPIFRGTDLIVLFVIVPATILAFALLLVRRSLRSSLFAMVMLAVLVYYAAGMAFGAAFNSLHLAYIALFSSSLFGLFWIGSQINPELLRKSISGQRLPYRGFTIFLALSGFALIVAWLPDILSAVLAGQPLALIENYTTEITYVLDMGIIGPLAIVGIILLKRRSGAGYMVLASLLTLCAAVGLMLPVQSIFQANAGIDLPLPVLVTKVATFCLLAIFAIYFDIRLFRAIKTDKA